MARELLGLKWEDSALDSDRIKDGHMLRPAALSLVLTTALLVPALAQQATPEQMSAHAGKQGYGTMNFHSGLGSFKIFPGEGRCEVSFTGTVLISGLDGDIEVSPGLKVEFDGMGRQVYHGTGRIVTDGKWRAFHWFGSDMTGVWYGRGSIRLQGEFDNTFSTGQYWYENPDVRGAWPTSMQTFSLPEQRAGADAVEPTRRGQGGN